MNIYSDYCYPDMTAVINSVVSQPARYEGTNIIVDTLVSVSGNTAVFNNSLGNYTRTFTECINVGPVVTNTMMSTSDAVQLATAIMLVWVSAWAIKVLRRAM